MTAVIKSSDAAASRFIVRSLAGLGERREVPAEPEARHDAELIGLKLDLDLAAERIAAGEAEIRRLEGAVEQAFAAGEAKGRLAGKAESDTLEAQRLEALRAGVAAALEGFAASLGSMDRLAALLSREALGMMIGDPAFRSELLAGTIRLELDKLAAQASVCVHVARDDFEDPAQLAALADQVGRSPLDLRVSDELEAGQCAIKLRLGTLEIGIDQQWEAIARGLTEIARPGAAQ